MPIDPDSLRDLVLHDQDADLTTDAELRLDGLHDVTVDSPAAGDTLAYDDSPAGWVNTPAPVISGFDGGTVANATEFLDDVTVDGDLISTHASSHEADGSDPITTIPMEGRAALFQGSWSAADYAVGNCVEYFGGLYQARVATSSEPGMDATWDSVTDAIVLSGSDGDPNTLPVPATTGALYLSSATGTVWRYTDALAWENLSLEPPFVATDDPGAVGAGAIWLRKVDSSGLAGGVPSVAYAIRVRDDGNAAWIPAPHAILGEDDTIRALIREDDSAGGGEHYEVLGYDGDGNWRNDISIYDTAIELNHLREDETTAARLIVGDPNGDAEAHAELRTVDTDGASVLAQLIVEGTAVDVVTTGGGSFKWNGDTVATV